MEVIMCKRNLFLLLFFFIIISSAYSQQPKVNNIYDVYFFTNKDTVIKTGEDNIYLVFSGKYKDMNVLFFGTKNNIEENIIYFGIGGYGEKGFFELAYIFGLHSLKLQNINAFFPDFNAVHIGYALFEPSIQFKTPRPDVIDRIYPGYIYTDDEDIFKIGLLREYFRTINSSALEQYNKHQKYLDDIMAKYKTEPKPGDKYYNRAVENMGKKEYDKAFTDLNATIKINPKYVDAYILRSGLYVGKKEYDKAIADCNAALKIDPNYATAFFARGVVYFYKQELDKAIADFEMALQINPNDYDTKKYLEEAREVKRKIR
jgi:hypothetical protein